MGLEGQQVDGGTRGGHAYVTFCLLDHATGVHAGPWVDLRGYARFSLEATGLAGETIQLLASNAAECPTTWEAGHAVEVVTADGITEPSMPPVRWVAAQIVDPAEGKVTLMLHALT